MEIFFLQEENMGSTRRIMRFGQEEELEMRIGNDFWKKGIFRF